MCFLLWILPCSTGFSYLLRKQNWVSSLYNSYLKILKKSVWIWGIFCLLVWVILLKQGYIFVVAFFLIFPGLKQVHKKGKYHNGYSILNGHHSDKPVLENCVKILISSLHPDCYFSGGWSVPFPCEIPCHNSEKKQMFGSFSLLSTFGHLAGYFSVCCAG